MMMPKRPSAGSPQSSYHQAIWDVVESLRNAFSSGRRISSTTRGVIHHADAQQAGGTAPAEATLQFKGQWSAASDYDEDDIVIRALGNEVDDGNLIGTYIANQDIAVGGAAEVAAGQVPSFPLHEISQWDLFAIVPNTKFVLRSGDQTIEIVSGDSEGTTDPKIELVQDRTAPVSLGPRIILDLGDCGGDIIKVRSVPLCEVDVNTGIPTIGSRLFVCGPFHAA